MQPKVLSLKPQSLGAAYVLVLARGILHAPVNLLSVAFTRLGSVNIANS